MYFLVFSVTSQLDGNISVPDSRTNRSHFHGTNECSVGQSIPDQMFYI